MVHLMPLHPKTPSSLFSATSVHWQHDTAYIHLLHATAAAVNHSCLRAHSSKPAAAGLLLWAHTGTDSRTDTVPFHRPCCAYYARSADNGAYLLM